VSAHPTPSAIRQRNYGTSRHRRTPGRPDGVIAGTPRTFRRLMKMVRVETFFSWTPELVREGAARWRLPACILMSPDRRPPRARRGKGAGVSWSATSFYEQMKVDRGRTVWSAFRPRRPDPDRASTICLLKRLVQKGACPSKAGMTSCAGSKVLRHPGNRARRSNVNGFAKDG